MNPWETVFQQAVDFHGHGQLAEAASLFVAILEHNPDHFPSLHRLAAIRRHQGRLEESKQLLEQAATANPESADIHNSLANTLNALGRQEEAVAEYRSALTQRPDFPEAQLNLGNSLKALGHLEEAAAAYRAAITLRPAYVEAHTNLGVALERLNQPEQALASFSAALQHDPQVHLGFNNVGMALAALNRHEEALPFLERARIAEPDALEPIFNEGIIRLALGDFERGWPCYETRLRMPELAVARHFLQPRWQGENIAGKTILIHAEQGMGDTILFARYVEPIVKTGAHVLLEVHKPLVDLMKQIPGVAQVFSPGEPLPDFDVHASFVSLPLLFGTTAATIPSPQGYLPPSNANPGHGLRAGICWAGNPKYALDYRRSIPLQTFRPLFDTESVHFVSLQKDLRPGDNLPPHIQPMLKAETLADTAALISSLDLVITVDTVIAHLAGALGIPVWILLPFSAHWVWGRHRTDSDWYKTAKLFRQKHPGNWAAVIESVRAELSAHARNGRPR
jgi:tetratricopeptide (TPR) repeat protein